MTNEEFDAIYERVNKATPGPWEVDTLPNRVVTMDTATMDEWDTDQVATFECDEDAEFIAHARTDIPALLAEVGRLRNQLQARMVLLGEFDN